MLTNNFLTFLKDPSRNNNTEWFNQNKQRSEEEVKKTFESFVRELINEIKILRLKSK